MEKEKDPEREMLEARERVGQSSHEYLTPDFCEAHNADLSVLCAAVSIREPAFNLMPASIKTLAAVAMAHWYWLAKHEPKPSEVPSIFKKAFGESA